MKITRKDVEYVANLARLSLSEEEIKQYSSQLESILSYIDQLKEANTDKIEPLSYVVQNKGALREDNALPSDAEMLERIMSNAPGREGNFYKVKKVID